MNKISPLGKLNTRLRTGLQIMIDRIILLAPGMRITKTVLAIAFCLVIDWLRKASNPYNAAIAALVCLQKDFETTRLTAKNRVLGTTIAGVYSYLFLIFAWNVVAVNHDGVLYRSLTAVGLIPLMMLLVQLKLQGAISIAGVVYIMICVNTGLEDPLKYTVSRVLDTFLGIGTAIFFDWLPPLNWVELKMAKSRELAKEELTQELKQLPEQEQKSESQR